MIPSASPGYRGTSNIDASIASLRGSIIDRYAVDLGNISGAVTIDLTKGDIFIGTLTGDVVITWAGLPVDAGLEVPVQLQLSQDHVTPYTVTINGTGIYPGGVSYTGPALGTLDIINYLVDYASRWVGYVAGGGGASAVVSGSTSLTASTTATGSILLSSTLIKPFQVLQVKSTVVSGSVWNYNLELYDGDPSSGGVRIYQALGITNDANLDPYVDNAVFYVPALTTWSLYAKISNIDADAMTVDVAVTYLGVTAG